jgi:hypothetical protein
VVDETLIGLTIIGCFFDNDRRIVLDDRPQIGRHPWLRALRAGAKLAIITTRAVDYFRIVLTTPPSVTSRPVTAEGSIKDCDRRFTVSCEWVKQDQPLRGI